MVLNSGTKCMINEPKEIEKCPKLENVMFQQAPSGVSGGPGDTDRQADM